MKSRYSALTILAVCLFAAPTALAQRGVGDADSGTIGYIPGGPPSNVISRVFTHAALKDSAGEVIGKVKTATIETTAKIQMALRLQVTGLTPNTEYALVIDSTLVGTDTADVNGVLKMKFASPTAGRVPALPDVLKPIAAARQVQLYQVASQRLVASGQFGSYGAGAGNR
ncbi:MAG: hypothetical protein IT175_17320 [Acidobacteria bacterium]|nr:hypothetical protein [Acidobacteriota bacterium]